MVVSGLLWLAELLANGQPVRATVQLDGDGVGFGGESDKKSSSLC